MQRFKKEISILGKILMLIAILAIWKKLRQFEWQYNLPTMEQLRKLVLITLFQTAIIISLYIPWKEILEVVFNQKMNKFIIISIHTEANILKYIPGNIFQYVGKGRLTCYYPIRGKEIAIATFIDVCVNLIAIAFIILFFGSQFLLEYFNIFKEKTITFLIIIIMVGSILGIAFLKRSYKNLRKYFTGYNIKKVIIGFLTHLLLMLLYILTYVLVLMVIFPYALNLSQIPFLIGVFSLSWIGGMIVPGVPGGIGIREYIMLIMTAGIFQEEIITFSMVIFRVINILSDIFTFLIGQCVHLFFVKKKRGKNYEKK